MTKRQEVYEIAEQMGLTVATWSPGDSVTRYRIIKGEADYFSADGDQKLYTALGPSEALTYLYGYRRGFMNGKQEGV